MEKLKKLKKAECKKLSVILGIPAKNIQQIIKDLQVMGLLKHVDQNEWRLFDGTEWQTFEL